MNELKSYFEAMDGEQLQNVVIWLEGINFDFDIVFDQELSRLLQLLKNWVTYEARRELDWTIEKTKREAEKR